MEHEMKLQPDYYNYILNGTKRIEIRLYDEKRQLIKIGDTIKFLKEPELNESFNAKVIGLLRYNSFKDIFPLDNIVGDANVRDKIAGGVADIDVPDVERRSLVQHPGVSRDGVALGNSLHMAAADLDTHTGTAGTKG